MPQRGHRKSYTFTTLPPGYLCFLPLTHPLSVSSSAFFVFCSDHRPRIKEENPGISIGDIAKKLGELWATQSSKDKAPYEAKAAKLKEKYEKVSTCFQAFLQSANDLKPL